MADAAFVRPGDVRYDELRRVWNAMVDRRPAVIARCRETADVVAAIRLARREGLEIGVRCGGHSVVGLAVPDGGLMIDLTPMGGVRVDVDRRRARVQGGALLGALDAATQPHGLATTAGNVGTTRLPTCEARPTDRAQDAVDPDNVFHLNQNIPPSRTGGAR